MESRRRKKYTVEEDRAIFKAVEEAEGSLKSCFIAVAEELNRTPSGVAVRWYKDLSNPNSQHYMGTAMIMLKQKRAAINRTTMKFPINTTVSFWQRIKQILHL